MWTNIILAVVIAVIMSIAVIKILIINSNLPDKSGSKPQEDVIKPKQGGSKSEEDGSKPKEGEHVAKEKKPKEGKKAATP